MTNLEKLQEAAKENKELLEALNGISGESKEEAIQKVLATAGEYGFDLEEEDLNVQEALSLDDLEQIAGGAYGWEARHFGYHHDKSDPFYFALIQPR